jgi:RNAse (barnase) inhibitor barstar
MAKAIIEIDGSRFNTLDAFYAEISARLIPGAKWGKNFDAFNDILRGDFGTAEGGFKLRLVSVQRSRENLGYAETIRWLEKKIEQRHPDDVEFVKKEIESARRGEGPTIADIITDIIRMHGPGGDEEEDGVELELA